MNIYAMTSEEREKLGIDSLPSNLKDALDELAKAPVIREALGHHIYDRFVEAKTEEWDSFIVTVTQWELDRYLALY
ncbi:Glutamine synthetase type I [Desulfosporosinus sp. I2]|nr:Glutamine synthetase type I [Desulfosporosinus sp. I2]